MLIQEKVALQWKDAMKSRSPTKEALGQIQSEFKNKLISVRAVHEPLVNTMPPSDAEQITKEALAAKDFRTVLTDEEANQVLSKMSKQRRESILEFQKAGRQDLIDKESQELSVIESFLPKQLTEVEIEELVRQAIKEVDATSQKDMGKLMKVLSPRVKGLADGRLVQQKVKEALV